MKNLFLLLTDKPSILFIDNDDKKLRLYKKPMVSEYVKNQNIYITNEEKIKEGDWVVNFNSIYAHKELCRIDNQLELKRYAKKASNDCKKIILTTDQDLIKDGVQAIDDEFLEWFVKNPNCEYVKVKNSILKIPNRYDDDYRVIPYLKIIIPKEEPIQSTKDRILSETSDEIKQKVRETANDLVSKQETLEKAAIENNKHNWKDTISAFIDGATWQAEKMYSKEQRLKAFSDPFGQGSLERDEYKSRVMDKLDLDRFEQFKNKSKVEIVKSITNCPTCGSEVTVKGDVTHFYSPANHTNKETLEILKLAFQSQGVFFSESKLNQIIEKFKK